MTDTTELAGTAARLIDDRPETVWLFEREVADADECQFAIGTDNRDGSGWLLAMVCEFCAVAVAESVGSQVHEELEAVQYSLDEALDLAKRAFADVPCNGLWLADHVGGPSRYVWVR